MRTFALGIAVGALGAYVVLGLALCLLVSNPIRGRREKREAREWLRVPLEDEQA